ncbi:EamA family transporter [Acuticoccus sp.]|uniref:EamA family transporter n=1 Tax=Acuticoccus sp. TaxID=1904378 RepID=UPI003B530120
MTDWLWVIFTLVAAASQTARNSMQKELTSTIGTVAATQARFLFGLPFAVLFLAVSSAVLGAPPSILAADTLAFTFAGGLTQVFATAMMLAAMRTRSFVVTITYTKIEPVIVLLFALVFLSELPTPAAILGVIITTVGVLVMSWPRGATRAEGWLLTTALGLGAGALFAASAVFYRGGILSLPDGPFVLNATATLVTALAFQSVAVTLYLAIFDRPALVALLRAWRRSLPAGFFGALASQFWFLAFAIQSASLVRALALVEILFAQAISRRLFQQTTSGRELFGIVLIVAGVLVLLLAGT